MNARLKLLVVWFLFLRGFEHGSSPDRSAKRPPPDIARGSANGAEAESHGSDFRNED